MRRFITDITSNFSIFIGLSISLLSNVVSAQDIDPPNELTAEKVANDFFQIQQVSSVKIAPNGQFVSYKRKTGKKEQLVVQNSRTGRTAVAIEDSFNDAMELYDYYWIDNKSIIIQAFIRGKGSALIHSQLSLENDTISKIDTKLLVEGVTILDPLQTQDNKILAKKWIHEKAYIFKLDVSTKSTSAEFKRNKRLNLRAPKNPHWLTDAAGNIAIGYGLDTEDKVNRAWLKPIKSRKWDMIWEGSTETIFTPVLVSVDRKIAHVLSNENSDLICLYTFDLLKKKYIDELFCHSSYDINAAITNPSKTEILGISIVEDGFLQTLYFNSLDQILDVALAQEFDNSIPYIIDYSLDKSIFIVESTSNSNPGDYFIYNSKTELLTKFASKAPWLDKYQHSQSVLIRAKSSDGQEIESYLSLPFSANVKDPLPPLIVMPHGGPISVRDTRHFDRHVQFLVALGYAVLQPNYRGSSGYGKTFLNMGMGQWGRLIEDDIEASVREVIDQDFVNKDKVCIYGISYGGYSALISSIHRPDLFKCAASYAGVTDLPLLFNEIALVNSSGKNNMMKKIVGDPETGMQDLIYFSPVFQAKDIAIPIMIGHGLQDRVVDIEHYYRLKKVLDVYEKPYQEISFDDESHGFRYLENVVEFYIQLDLFFQHSFVTNDLK